MLDKINSENASGIQPYFIYQRIALNAPKVFFLFPLDYGFWFVFRRILALWPERDAASTMVSELLIEINEQSSGHNLQQDAFPVRLICTPGKDGVFPDVPSGRLTATSPKLQPFMNTVLPQRDNILISVSGQAAGFPVNIDLCVMGYLVPDAKLDMWKGAHE
jgi:hypothetical protein